MANSKEGSFSGRKTQCKESDYLYIYAVNLDKISFYIQKLCQFMNGKCLWSHIFHSITLSPILFIKAGKSLLVELCLCCLQALQEVFVILEDFSVFVVLCLDSCFICLNFSIPALDSGPTKLLCNDQKSIKPRVVLTNCLSVNLFNWIINSVRRSKSLLILYSLSTA